MTLLTFKKSYHHFYGKYCELIDVSDITVSRGPDYYEEDVLYLVRLIEKDNSKQYFTQRAFEGTII